jgi:hypothetical protein
MVRRRGGRLVVGRAGPLLVADAPDGGDEPESGRLPLDLPDLVATCQLNFHGLAL